MTSPRNKVLYKTLEPTRASCADQKYTLNKPDKFALQLYKRRTLRSIYGGMECRVAPVVHQFRTKDTDILKICVPLD